MLSEREVLPCFSPVHLLMNSFCTVAEVLPFIGLGIGRFVISMLISVGSGCGARMFFNNKVNFLITEKRFASYSNC